MTDVEICNLALARLGCLPITALTDDSNEGRLCNLYYKNTYQRVLRSHPWKCAIKRAVLADNGNDPEFEWAQEYNLPEDCLRVLEMQDPFYEFEVKGNVLQTDETTAEIKYVAEVQTGDLEADVIKVIYMSLAIEMCMGLTQDTKLLATLTEELSGRNGIMYSAKHTNALEQNKPDVNKQETSWSRARNAGTTNVRST